MISDALNCISIYITKEFLFQKTAIFVDLTTNIWRIADGIFPRRIMKFRWRYTFVANWRRIRNVGEDELSSPKSQHIIDTIKISKYVTSLNSNDNLFFFF